MLKARDAMERPDHEPAGAVTDGLVAERPEGSSELSESRRRSVRIVARAEDDWPATITGLPA